MGRRFAFSVILSLLAAWCGGRHAGAAEAPAVTVVGYRIPAGTYLEELAAEEVRRYLYLRTGRYLPFADAASLARFSSSSFFWTSGGTQPTSVWDWGGRPARSKT